MNASDKERKKAAKYPFLLSLPSIDRYPLKGSQSESRILRAMPCAKDERE